MSRGSFLALQRTKIGLSQAEVGAKLGYSAQLVSLWEKDKVIPDLSVASSYASILGIDLEGFINLEETHDNDFCDSKIFDINKFGNNLRYLRKLGKLTQAQVAEKAGTNVKTVGAWEKGASTPSIDHFILLCDIFKLSYDEFYFAVKDAKKLYNKKRKKIIIPIVFPVVIVVGVATTGITRNAINRRNFTKCEHEYVEEVIEATYEETGKITYKCINCGYFYEVATPVLEHHYSEEYVYDNEYHYHQCIDEGYETLHTEPKVHRYNVETIAATYENEGLERRTCMDCGYISESSIPTLEHHYADEYVSDGEYHYHKCIDEGYESLHTEPKEHRYHIQRTEPTYESDGLESGLCIDCGYTYEKVLPKLIHKYADEWSSYGAYHYHKCLDEGFEYLEADKADHDFVLTNDDEEVKTYTCSTCGYSFNTTYPNLAVLDVYQETRDYNISCKDFDSCVFYVKLFNPLKYDFYKGIYHIDLIEGGDGVDPMPTDWVYIWADDDFTLFRIDPIVFSSSYYFVPGTVIDLYFKYFKIYGEPSQHVDQVTYRITYIE